MSERQRRIACVFGRDASGKILLQMRDSGGGAHDPADALRWCFFGGHMDDDATSIKAALREFEEETSIVLGEDELEFLGERDIEGDPHYLFVVKRPLSWQEIYVREGAGAGFFTMEEIKRIPIISSTAALVEAFL
jgi:8-oxo-dGTP pyrophosphatase MutT (NUDIX family)